MLLMMMFLTKIICAQNSYQFGLLPVLNMNKKLNDVFKLNLKTEARESIYKAGKYNFQHDLIDISAIISKKVGLNQSVAGGYLFRVKNKEIVHGLIQQYVTTHKYFIIRMAHRFSSDQTFAKENTTIRLRYRISSQIPLQGQSVNSKEFYLKTNNEYLNTWKSGGYDLEIRLSIILGYEFNDNNKLEFGIENRADSFIGNTLRNRSWFNIGWYVSL